MNKLTLAVFGLAMAAAMPLLAQQTEEPMRDERRPSRGEDRPRSSETLTEAQREQVKAILSRYDARGLTADQAKAIHEAFRQAGLRGGPHVNDAVRAAGFDPERLRDLAQPPGQDRRGGGDRREEGGDPRRDPQGQEPRGKESFGQGQKYTLEQAISDRAQLSTIAFSGLAFLTGDFGAATFIPPGKVCDYFGFQYMRDIDAAGKGHNPVFLNRVAGNVLFILNDHQRKMFQDLASEQCAQFEELAMKRLPLIKAFHRERDGALPQGSAGLNREAVKRYVGDLFALDAELSYRRTEVFGKIVASLTNEQKAYLGKMKFGDYNTWPAQDEKDKLKRPAQGTSKFYNVAYMTYASEFFSWYAGSVEADVYFCPERHGTYFGGFYMKDMPAMGKRDYDISTSVTGDSGETFLKLLTAEQRPLITSIIEAQRGDLKETIEVRRAISTELRKFLKGETADKPKVLALGRRYGELDGEMSWMYATAFAKVNRTLTGEQRAAFKKLRNLEGYTSAPAYLYSQPLPTLPRIQDTDFFFRPPSGAAATMTAPTAASAAPSTTAQTGFAPRGLERADGGTLPKEFAADGASATPPLELGGAPSGTTWRVVSTRSTAPGGDRSRGGEAPPTPKDGR